jgi:hypothetical protein
LIIAVMTQRDPRATMFLRKTLQTSLSCDTRAGLERSPNHRDREIRHDSLPPVLSSQSTHPSGFFSCLFGTQTVIKIHCD